MDDGINKGSSISIMTFSDILDGSQGPRCGDKEGEGIQFGLSKKFRVVQSITYTTCRDEVTRSVLHVSTAGVISSETCELTSDTLGELSSSQD